MAADGSPKVMQDPSHMYQKLGAAGPEAPKVPKAKVATDAYNVAWNQMRRPFGRKLK